MIRALLTSIFAGVPERSKGQGLGVINGLDKMNRILELEINEILPFGIYHIPLDISASNIRIRN